jgi:Flp pilus assembly protein TadB
VRTHDRRARERRIPKRPYRDSAILYGALAVVIVVVAVATGGSLVRAALSAVAFFALATAWSWHRWRTRPGNEGRR